MSDTITQSAGDCRIEVYTGGSPLWPEIRIHTGSLSEVMARVSVAHLHDLRYCIDRVLSQLGERAP